MIIDIENLPHIVDRIKLRIAHADHACIDMIGPTMERHFIDLKHYFESALPTDWRFSTHPSAVFLLLYKLNVGGQLLEFPIVGRTCRISGKDLVEEILACINTNGCSYSIQGNELQQYVAKYIINLRDPQSEIIHRFKTVFSMSNLSLSDLKTSYTHSWSQLPHMVLLNRKKMSSRPNAIIEADLEDPDKFSVWVRQLEYSTLSNESQHIDYLIFCPLTRDGADKNKCRCFSFGISKDGKGVLEEQENDLIFELPKTANQDCLSRKLPSDYRSNSYWTLPTYLDMVFLDLEYKYNEIIKFHSKSSKVPSNGIAFENHELCLYFNLKMIRDIARKIWDENEQSLY